MVFDPSTAGVAPVAVAGPTNSFGGYSVLKMMPSPKKRCCTQESNQPRLHSFALENKSSAWFELQVRLLGSIPVRMSDLISCQDVECKVLADYPRNINPQNKKVNVETHKYEGFSI